MAYNVEIPGWMDERELQAIERLAQLVPKVGTVVELGAFCGRSSWAWAKTCSPKTRVYCIDFWNQGFESFPKNAYDSINPPLPCKYGDSKFSPLDEFKKNTRDCPNIVAIQGRNPEGIRWQGEKIDLMFIDDHHTREHMIRSFKFWRPYLNEGAIICGHDFREEEFPGTVLGVHWISRQMELPFRVFEKTSLWFLETPALSEMKLGI